jgi:polar amino acid transport system substrate-binding protein
MVALPGAFTLLGRTALIRHHNQSGGNVIVRRLFSLAATAATILVLTSASPSLAAGEMRVGSTATGVPFTFLDTKSNSIQGFMVDLVTAVGNDAGFKVTIEPMPFSALIAGLTANKIDIISAAMYITPTRKEVIDFSTPIYTYGEGLIVAKKDEKDYKSFDDLKGEIVGAQVGTAYVEPLTKSGLFKEVKIYDTIPDILRDVNAGRIKAGFADFPILAYNLSQGLFPEVRLAKNYKPTLPGSIGIGVRKADQELLTKINTSVAKLQKDGTTAKIAAKWGLE